MTPLTPPDGTDAHPEVAEISDLTEGLLAVSRAQQVRAHLADCPLCADVHDSLREIRDTLGTLPGPDRMPDDVAGRIDAALAAEALLDAHRPAPVSRETGPGEPAAVSRETTAGATPGGLRSAGRSAGRAPGRARSDGPTRPGGSGPGRRTGRNGRRLRTLLATAGALGALVLGGALFQGLGGSSAGSNADPSVARDRSADDGAGAMAGESLEHRVQTLLEKQPAQSSPGLTSETGQPEDTAPLVGGPTTVPSCVRAGIDRPEQPLAAEAGRPYAGHPSYLVVLPHPGDPQRVDAYLVDSSCTAETDPGPGRILVERTYRRD